MELHRASLIGHQGEDNSRQAFLKDYLFSVSLFIRARCSYIRQFEEFSDCTIGTLPQAPLFCTLVPRTMVDMFPEGRKFEIHSSKVL